VRVRKGGRTTALQTRSGPSRSIVFSLGVGIGALGGVVVGTLVGKHVVHLIGMIIGLIDRRFTGSDDERLNFELLLQ
jgi:uncharacterized membrane protein